MPGKPRRNPVTDEQIIASYQETHSTYKTAEALGLAATTVHRALCKHGVELIGLAEYRRNATMFRGQENEIRRVYEEGLTLDQLRERFGEASDYAYQHAIKRAGGVLREWAVRVKPGELEKIIQMNKDGVGQVAISLALGRSQSFVSDIMRRNGLMGQKASGAAHGMWKGGRWQDKNGYWRVKLLETDPMFLWSMAQSGNYVLEHRLIMAKKINRALEPHETVHHINGDKTDNRPENLQLRYGKHGKHSVLVCADCGSHNIKHAGLEE
jgi:hypothetical protein